MTYGHFQTIYKEVKLSRLQYIEVDELAPKDRHLLKLPLKLFNSRTVYTTII